jgi:hypothetical protein
MTVSGGSQVLVSGTNGLLEVGRNGTGTLTLTGGSTVDVAHGLGSTGQTFVGATAPGLTPATVPLAGSIIVANGSTLNAGSLLGIASDGVTNSTGTGSVLLSGLSTINAMNVAIGQNGVLGGNGTVNGNVTNNGGTLSPGASPDPLYINGNYAQSGGKINLEIDPDGRGGFLTDTLVFGPGDLVGITGATIDFNFLNGANPALFAADGLFNLDTFFRVENGSGTGDLPLSAELPLDAVFSGDIYSARSNAFDITSFTFSPDTGAQLTDSVPEPGTLSILAAALVGFVGLGRRRHGQWPDRRPSGTEGAG